MFVLHAVKKSWDFSKHLQIKTKKLKYLIFCVEFPEEVMYTNSRRGELYVN